MANTYLTRTPSSASNRKTWTWSGWIKLGVLGTDRNLFGAYANANDNLKINIADTDTVSIRFYNGSEFQLGLNRVFRDTSAWYHLVFAVDTTLNTAADRFKIYVNGARESSFAAEDQPTQDLQMTINNTTATQIGRFNTGSYFDGSMAMVEFVDGTALTPASFGSTDSNTGIWTPSGATAISDYGTNGFKLAMDTTTPGADTSGKGNNFTVGGGTPTLLQGNPQNNWCTLNPIDVMSTSSGGTNGTLPEFSNGNTTYTKSGGTYNRECFGSTGLSKGKWYWELKPTTLTGNAGPRAGVFFGSDKRHTNSYYFGPDGFMVFQNGSVYYNSGTFTYGAAFVQGNVINCALDMDGGNFYMGVNNSWANGSGAWANSFASASSANSVASFTFPTGEFGQPFFGMYVQSDNSSINSVNFGEGFFGTTAAGTSADGNGQGLFAYAPPTGYYALNTKNLEAYG